MSLLWHGAVLHSLDGVVLPYDLRMDQNRRLALDAEVKEEEAEEKVKMKMENKDKKKQQCYPVIKTTAELLN